MFLECEIIFKYVLRPSVSNSIDREISLMTVKSHNLYGLKIFSPDLALSQKTLSTMVLY